MSRFLQVFGQPGAHSLYTIVAGQVIAVKKHCEKERKLTSMDMCFSLLAIFPPFTPTKEFHWIPYL